jgi:hypothetical protein
MDFWQSLVNNRQWIFDGIGGVAIIAIVTGIGKVLYVRYIQPEKSDKPIANIAKVDGSATVQQGQVGIGHIFNVNGPIATLTVTDRTANLPVEKAEMSLNLSAIVPATFSKMSTITMKRIEDDFDSVPPYQQHEKGRYYEGLSIDWNLQYRSTYPQENGMVSVTMKSLDKCFMTCHCSVLLSDYPALKILPSDAPIRIVGKMEKVTHFDIHVIEAKLFF